MVRVWCHCTLFHECPLLQCKLPCRKYTVAQWLPCTWSYVVVVDISQVYLTLWELSAMVLMQTHQENLKHDLMIMCHAYFSFLSGCLPTPSDISPLIPLVCSMVAAFTSQFRLDDDVACLAVFIALYGHVQWWCGGWSWRGMPSLLYRFLDRRTLKKMSPPGETWVAIFSVCTECTWYRVAIATG